MMASYSYTFSLLINKEDSQCWATVYLQFDAILSLPSILLLEL